MRYNHGASPMHSSNMAHHAEPPRAIRELLDEAGIRINGDAPWDMRVLDSTTYRRILIHGSLGLGEAYMDGLWETDQLDEFIHRLLRRDLNEKVGSWRRWRLFGSALRHLLDRGAGTAVRDRGLAQLRPGLRPHLDGVVGQLRRRLAPIAEPLLPALPSHVEILSVELRRVFPRPPGAALATGAEQAPAFGCLPLGALIRFRSIKSPGTKGRGLLHPHPGDHPGSPLHPHPGDHPGSPLHPHPGDH